MGPPAHAMVLQLLVYDCYFLTQQPRRLLPVSMAFNMRCGPVPDSNLISRRLAPALFYLLQDLPHRLPEDCQSAILPRNCLAKRQRLMDFWAREKCTREAIIPPPAPAPMASGNTAPAASREIPDSGENNDTLGAGVDTPLPGPPGGFHSPQVGVAPSASGASARVGRDNENPLTVWTDLPYLCDSVTGLTRPEFRVLESGASPRGADVLWASRSIDQNFEAAMG